MSVEFIKMISELHEQRFNVHLEHLVKNRTPCGIFFGFIMIPSDAATNFQSFIKTGLNVTCAIVIADVQANVLRQLINVPVITLEDFPNFGEKNFPDKPQEVFFSPAIKDFAFITYFERYGIEILTLPDNRQFLFTMKHLAELYSVYEMFGTEESKKVFRAAIKGKLTGKISDYRFATEPQYFLSGFTPNFGDIAIDGGTYDGSTAISFAKCGAKVYAFEMNAINYKNCVERLKKFGKEAITLENFGLSDKEGEENYSSWGAGSRKDSSGNFTAKFIDLDTYAAKKILSRVDYIKLDIEGSELDMLRGAAKNITRCKPKMAISVYHKPEDLFTLAIYIKSLRPDYKFEFRHYKIDCTDYIFDDNERAILKYFGLDYFLPTPYEMVLYCG